MAVGDADRYCGKCGAPQPAGGAPPAGSRPTSGAADFLSGVNARTASLLCYIPLVGWIAAIVVLAATRFRRDYDVRFNAFQGLYLFVAWLIVDWVVSPIFMLPGMPMHDVFGSIFKLGIMVLWIFMLVKVSQGENYRLPVIGELAQRSVSEQV
jgi:uncharacterized membrane protein